jgi:predicted RNA-binding Zn-ribbon protein involved in translation (DUF1610 family)
MRALAICSPTLTRGAAGGERARTIGSPSMGGAADWLREERRKVLGTSAAVCLGCGAARRGFEEFEDEVPAECPACGGRILRRCPSCSAPLVSVFAVDCDGCGQPLRASELHGMRIRKPPR